MRRALLILLCAGTGGLAGCGSDEPASDAGQIQQTLDYYLLATQRHNADLMCTSVVIRPPDQSVEDCVNGFAEQMRDSNNDLFRPDELEVLRPPKIMGDTATVLVANDGRRFEVVLMRKPDGWRIVPGTT